MKKKELVLDFTSLLDVIMILLFVVISNMSQVSLSASKEADKALNEAQVQLEEMQGKTEALEEKLLAAQQIEEQYKEALKALEALQSEHEKLQDEHDYLKITSNYDAENTAVYEAAIERMAKLVLICDTRRNEQTGNQEVQINIYLDSNEEEQSYVAQAIIEHNLNLSKEDRAQFNAAQVTELTKVLSGVLRKEQREMIWFSVQYAYDDENFSNTDLEIINEAVQNLERSFSKSCYIEEIKLY
ncbi:MAG: hypothetical protein IJF07_00235 [Lachnospiraceae bacterium]|nr:hypothetical protein [Lachnospiraceae bacterium]